MADNTRGGSNDAGLPNIASDDIAGVQYQRVKPTWGVDGSAVDTSASNPLPVVQTGTPALPTGAATETTLAAASGKLPATLGQKAKAASLAVTLASDEDAFDVTGSVVASGTIGLESNAQLGIVTETAPATDTASSGLNGRLQRIAQRITSLIAVFNIGAGTEAAAVRVTLPTDGTGKVNAAQSGTWNTNTVSTVTSITNAVHVDDNAGSLTVDGTVAVSAVTPGTAATNLGKAEDAAHTSGDVGVMSLAVRNDAGTVLAGTTGDYIPLTTDSTGALRTTATGGGGGTEYTEDAASAGAEALTLAGAVRQDAIASSTTTDGDYASLKVNAVGRLYTSTTVDAALPAGTNNIGDVDVLTLPALPAGNNNIGDVDVASLPALPAGTNNIGDVDVLSLPALPAGTNNIGDVDVLSVPAPLSTTGGGTEATAQRVTIANDSTGVLSVDDNGGSLTVDGTVTVNALPAGTNNIGDVDVLTVPADPFGANADAIVAAGAVGSLSAKLRRLTQGVEDLKTTIVLAAGAAAIGKLAANSGVDIGDVDVTTVGTITPGTAATSLGKAEDAAHTTGDVGVMALAVRNDAGTVLAGTTLDYVPLTTDATGALRTTGTGASSAAGDVAHDAVDSGNPVKIGGYADNSLPTAVAAGDRVNALFGLRGQLAASIAAGTMTAVDAVPNTDQLNLLGLSGGTSGLLPVALYMTNGTTFDRLWGNTTDGLAVELKKTPRSSTATTSSVADSASSVQLIGSAGGRRGASFYNDSTQMAYVKFGTTASVTDFTVPMLPGAFYEMEPTGIYTGRIDAIWAANASGSMRITEW